MKAPDFKYIRARTRAEVLELLALHGEEARILAGGQSLMPVLNMRLAAPAILIDINAVHELNGVSRIEGGLRIGALTRHFEVEKSPVVQKELPVLSEAMHHVAHAGIRNRGTFGGSIALADPAAEMPACCVALGARMVIESRAGRRTVPAEDFFTGIFETAIKPNELLVSVDFPATESGGRHSFLEFARRRGDFAIVGGILRVKIEARQLHEARLVFFGCAERPVRALKAEAILVRSPSIDAAIQAASTALQDELPMLDDRTATAEMRHHLARIVLVRLFQPFLSELD